jgi:cation:H+ antiporter
MVAIFTIGGLAALALGGELVVNSAIRIAAHFGMSEKLIGLTVVALGTSLPELVTSIVAVWEKKADLAIGNVIGSNMFNLLAIIGIAGLVGPINVDPEFLRFDLWVMLGASLLLIPFVYLGQNITRVWGIALSALYATYLLVVLAD